AERGGCAGAVRAEEAENHTLRNLQVDAGQGRRRPEALDHALDTNRGGRPVGRPAGRGLRQRIHERVVEKAAGAERSADSSHSLARCGVTWSAKRVATRTTSAPNVRSSSSMPSSVTRPSESKTRKAEATGIT